MKECIEWFRPENKLPDKKYRSFLLLTIKDDDLVFTMLGDFVQTENFEFTWYDMRDDPIKKDKVIAWAEMPKGRNV